jgi:hypothetical protein
VSPEKKSLPRTYQTTRCSLKPKERMYGSANASHHIVASLVTNVATLNQAVQDIRTALGLAEGSRAAPSDSAPPPSLSPDQVRAVVASCLEAIEERFERKLAALSEKLAALSEKLASVSDKLAALPDASERASPGNVAAVAEQAARKQREVLETLVTMRYDQMIPRLVRQELDGRAGAIAAKVAADVEARLAKEARGPCLEPGDDLTVSFSPAPDAAPAPSPAEAPPPSPAAAAPAKPVAAAPKKKKAGAP